MSARPFHPGKGRPHTAELLARNEARRSLALAAASPFVQDMVVSLRRAARQIGVYMPPRHRRDLEAGS